MQVPGGFEMTHVLPTGDGRPGTEADRQQEH